MQREALSEEVQKRNKQDDILKTHEVRTAAYLY